MSRTYVTSRADTARATRAMRRAFTQTLLPRGETTAYHVLRHVAWLIEEEPARLNMLNWVTKVKGITNMDVEDAQEPACGTIACAAGWIGLSTRMYRGIGPKTGRHLDALPNAANVFNFLGLGYYDGYTEFDRPRTVNRVMVRNALYELFHSTGLAPAGVSARLRDIARFYRPTLLRLKVVIK